jgi:hypothetical protein
MGQVRVVMGDQLEDAGGQAGAADGEVSEGDGRGEQGWIVGEGDEGQVGGVMGRRG